MGAKRSAIARAGAWVAVASGVWAGSAAGQQIVRGPAQDRPLTGTPETLYSVGVDEGEAWETFGYVSGVAFDRQGQLYVLDRDNGRVNVFGADGSHVRMIGRKGEGPGELAFPTAIVVMPDDRLVIYDMGSQALTVFALDGTYQETVRPRFNAMAVGNTQFAAYPRGGVLLQGSQFGGLQGGGPPTMADSVPIHLQPLDGGEARVLYRAPVPQPKSETSGSSNNMRFTVRMPPRFSPTMYWAPLADGRIAVAHGTEYAVNVVRADGTVGWVLTRPLEPRNVEEADREAERQRTREVIQNGGAGMMISVNNGRRTIAAAPGGSNVSEDEIRRRLAELEFADVMPQIHGVRTDLEGRFWIRRDAGPGVREAKIDLLAANGGYIGTLNGVNMPSAFGPNGLVAYVEPDEMGIQRVIVRRTPESWRR